MAVLLLDHLQSTVDPAATPTVPELRRGAGQPSGPSPAGSAGGSPRRGLDPASIELRPAGTRSITLRP